MRQMNYSIVLRGRRGGRTGTDSIIYIWEWDNQMEDVFRKRATLGVSMANHNLSEQPAACRWRQGRLATIF